MSSRLEATREHTYRVNRENEFGEDTARENTAAEPQKRDSDCGRAADGLSTAAEP